MKGPPVPVAFDDPAPSSMNSMGSVGSQGKGGNIPFMTFKTSGSSFDDLAQAPNSMNSQYSLNSGYQGNMGSMGSIGHYGGGSTSFDDEPPLLEELGIDPALVLKKSLEVLSPKNVDPKLLADGDISGLLLYGTALGLCHLLAGKVQFGDILGFSVLMLCGVYWIVNCMLAEEDGAIELNRVSSLSGYCLLPIVAYAALCVVMPARCIVGCVLCILAVLWSSHAATNAICAALPALRANKLLVGVPCFLMYSMYALLTIY